MAPLLCRERQSTRVADPASAKARWRKEARRADQREFAIFIFDSTAYSGCHQSVSNRYYLNEPIDMTAHAAEISDIRNSTNVAIDPGVSEPLRQLGCALMAIFWTLIYVWLWWGAPSLGKILGALWMLIGFFSPQGWFYTFALALPWFGNNPGGGHHLYLLEMGLMGLVVRHLVERAIGIRTRRPHWLDPWIILLVLGGWITLFAQWRWLRAEFFFFKADFIYRIYTHYGNADVFGLQMALKLTLSAGFFSCLRDRPWRMDQLTRWLGVALGVLALAAMAGLLDHAGLISLRWWRGENPDQLKFGYDRLQSLYWHAGWFAQYMTALAPAALAYGLLGRRPMGKLIALILVLIFAVATLLTHQRAGWLALAGGYCVVAALAPMVSRGAIASKGLGRRILYRLGATAVFLVVLAAILAATVPSLRSRIGELTAHRHRTELWLSALEVTKHGPLTGIGLGNYSRAHELLFPPGHPLHREFHVTAHNVFLHVLVERGAVNLVIFSVVFIGALVSAIRPLWLKCKDSLPDVHRLALIGCLSAFTVYGLFQYTYYIRTIGLLWWLMLGWATWDGRALPSPENRWHWIRRRLAIYLLFVLGFSALMLYEHRHWLIPYPVPVKDKVFRVGEERVELEIPEGTSRVALTLATADPAVHEIPVTYTIHYQDQPLAEIEFESPDYYENPQYQRLELDLPEPADGQTPIIVTASRTWCPWAYGLRILPFVELGILYQEPEVLKRQSPIQAE